MANTYTQILYHIVFSTKNRQPAITEPHRENLYRYIWGIHNNLKCHLYRIGGVADHIHILTSLHPTLALSKYIEQIKTSSTNWIRNENTIPGWPGWQDGYGAFTVSWNEKESLVTYIKNQPQHHAQTTFAEEYHQLLENAAIEFDDRYIVDPPHQT